MPTGYTPAKSDIQRKGLAIIFVQKFPFSRFLGRETIEKARAEGAPIDVGTGIVSWPCLAIVG
jgi:hypothetical protein